MSEATPYTPEALAETVKALLLQGHLLAVASSFGKDSMSALTLAVEGYRRAVRDGGKPILPLVVLSADTGIENPAIHAYVKRQIAHLEAYAAAEDLDIRVRVGRPLLQDTWVVRVLSGRALPSWPGVRRDCTRDLKIAVSDRSLRALVPDLQAEYVAAGDTHRAALIANAKPVVIVGTRFEESATRARNMTKRGNEAAAITWADKKGELPLIAAWSTDDVWEFLAGAGQGEHATFPGFAPDYSETLAVYRSATGECPVVATSQNGGSTPGPCSARFGCWACTAIQEDRSMRTMLTDPRFAHLEGLADLRDYVASLQNDWSKRRWAPRKADPVTGYWRFGPDSLHPRECEKLLRVCLSLDVKERRRALRLADARDRWEGTGRPTGFPWPDAYLSGLDRQGEAVDLAYLDQMVKPQFTIITLESLFMIGFQWSRYGCSRPFEALAIYREVYVDGHLTPVPAPAPVARTPMPEPRWYKPQAPEDRLPGLYDAVEHGMAGDTCPGAQPMRVKAGGEIRSMVGHQTGPSYAVDAESASLVLDLELDRLLAERGDMLPLKEALYYLQMGTVSLSHGKSGQSWVTAMHGQHLVSEGIRPDEPASYPPGTISNAEHAAIRDAMRAPKIATSQIDQLDIFAA